MGSNSWDVIVVGSRVAGAATALLLARQGLQVLVVDRARFPSDTLSSHQVQVPGAALLQRWGLLDQVVEAGTPPASRARFDLDGVVVAGPFPTVEGVGAVYSPRRLILDEALVRAARAAGAEVREGFTVKDLAWADGRVVGVCGHAGTGRLVQERAVLVVGADGRHSTVARLVEARRYRTRAMASFASYGYWSGAGLDGVARMYARPGLAVACFPTNDELSVVFQTQPRSGFGAFRGDVEAGLLTAADQCGDLGDRLRSGRRVERIRTTPDLPHALTVQHGPGWVLAGDAGAVMHPVTAHGITHALRDANRLAAAIVAGLGDPSRLDAHLREAWRRRDRQIQPLFDGTARLARMARITSVQRALLTATGENPDLSAAFIASFTGARPWQDTMTPIGAVRQLGAHGVLTSARRLVDPVPACFRRPRPFHGR